MSSKTAVKRPSFKANWTVEQKLAYRQLTKKHKEHIRRTGWRYVAHIPRHRDADRVLVHNHVRPQVQLGRNGFRAWTQRMTDDLVECHCDWAGVDLRGLKHYRIRLDPDRKNEPDVVIAIDYLQFTCECLSDFVHEINANVKADRPLAAAAREAILDKLRDLLHEVNDATESVIRAVASTARTVMRG